MVVQCVKFETRYRSTPQGMEPLDYVLLAPSGDGYQKQQTWHRISHIKPPEVHERDNRSSRASDHFAAMDDRWSVVGPKYEAWKKNNEVPEDGTPLAAWSGVSPELAEHLRIHMGIRTVEGVREMSVDHAGKLPHPNARKLPELAGKWLDGADREAAAQRDAEQEARIAALEAALAKATEDKPKRGRPAQAQETEAA